MGRTLGGMVAIREIEVGDSFTAVYVRSKDVARKDGSVGKLYHFREDGDQALFAVWGSAMLDQSMSEADVGAVLRVERVKDGKPKDKKSSPPKLWIVTVEKEAPTAA